MKIKQPSSPLSSGAEPPEPPDLRKTVESERFASTLLQLDAQASTSGTGQSSGATNEMRATLEQIASTANLTTTEGAANAVRESARFMIRSRLNERYRDTETAQRLTSELSDYIAKDPLLNTKLLSILQRIQAT